MERFIQFDPSVFDLSRINEGTEIIQTLTSSNAFYHKGCNDNFNDSHYERLRKYISKGRRFSLLNIIIPNKREKKLK